ncbi:hypothetical protein [Arthrobacter sp. zg-Y1143]|uniref:hypothetical protein n=1 Tax=Arthrobacter sp. zg-Y1143 TaxID=3049065 RepID=UPI0024C265F5|nr:hypothetical protein [Arthrobacter sp. zg-Y1143]MDK1326401.1 hypothetical protein [Arthrobacter sp. zg-Y1143]
MAERGNSTHGRRLDDEMKSETSGLTRNTHPDHVAEWRQPEPMPDDTDSEDVLAALDPNGTAPAVGAAVAFTSEATEAEDS